MDDMTIYDIPVNTLSGETADLADYKGRAVLVVNVASRCGLTPQYAGLERLHEKYKDRGFSVLGFPCNQFMGQEPGTPEEIATFCSNTFGVTFPMFEKIDVNGDGRHPLYRLLVDAPDERGYTGDIRWNFEKFLVSADGEVVSRFFPKMDPEDDRVITAIEESLPA